MPPSIDDAFQYLPPYLSTEKRQGLLDNIARLRSSAGQGFFTSQRFENWLQGDAFVEAPYLVIELDGEEVRPTRVMVLSNTCDIDPSNARSEPNFVVIAPIVRLSKWRQLLISCGVVEQTVDDKFRAARAQELSTVFHLPADGGIEEESVVFLDQIQSMPLERFSRANPRRIATLSQAGFWLLLVKLSVHFCRQHEGIDRDGAESAGLVHTD